MVMQELHAGQHGCGYKNKRISPPLLSTGKDRSRRTEALLQHLVTKMVALTEMLKRVLC